MFAKSDTHWHKNWIAIVERVVRLTVDSVAVERG